MTGQNPSSILVLANKRQKTSSGKEAALRTLIRNSGLFNLIHWRNIDCFDKNYFAQIEALEPENHSLILLSAELPEKVVSEIKTRLHNKISENPRPPIILFSFEREIEKSTLIRCLMAGAEDILLQPFTQEKLDVVTGKTGKRSSDFTNNNSQARLRIAIDMLIQESISACQTPSMVKLISEETREKFGQLTRKSLANRLLLKLSSMNHTKRIENYNSLLENITYLVSHSIKKLK
ncbi:MAG TPA: hypothetical protein PKA63_09315 [Oligoflexia bacterium]|nr:hypothetical protein [Oligoflexia bacterium]HMP48852.1 hypothetical protein [Oligoflexia bacterium]